MAGSGLMWGSAPGRGAARALVVFFVCALSALPADTMGVKQRRERVTQAHTCVARARSSLVSAASAYWGGALSLSLSADC